MSDITLQDLLRVHAGPWHAAADAWRRLATVLDDTDEQLTSGTRDLPEAWRSGDGAMAAREKAGTLRTRTSSTYSPVKSIGEQLDLHGYAMEALRQQAEQVIASAQQAGYSVDTAAVTVTAVDTSAYLGGALDRTGRETGALLNDLRTLVDRARAQDAQTAGVLNGNVPSAASGAWAGQDGKISRAEELALKIKDPAYVPTPAELDELSDLLTTYGKDKVFAFELLNTLGPKGLLELNGTLATYQLDRPGRDDLLFDRGVADTVRDLQLGLGTALETATDATGTRGGLRGETYTPGRYELSDRWVSDLMAAGRSRMDIGDPDSPARHVEDVYGYQLLGPLLRSGDLDPAFVSTVGGDIVDFEMSQGKNSDLWTESRSENVRLDWTRGHDDNATPAGYDPVTALMSGLSENGAGTRDLLTGVTQVTADGPPGGRLPRLDYLLTDRNWNPDTPGGPGWTAELMENGESYQKVGLDQFGIALERATIDHPGEESRRLIEAIVYETNVDEEAKGAADGAKPEDGKTEGFAKTDLVEPELRDSMGRIMSNHIVDVNQNIAPNQPVTRDSFQVDQTHLTRFLADLGKDETAHRVLVEAEAVYATAMHDEILSGRLNPENTLRENLDAMKVVSHNYGSVVGVLDFGAAAEQHATSAELDEKHNTGVEDRYKVIGPLVEMVVGASTAPVPGGSDLINGIVGNVLSDLEEGQKIDGAGRTTFEVGAMLGDSRSDAVALTEGALYYSGKLENLPDRFYQDDQLKPMNAWTNEDHLAWNLYQGREGLTTVGDAAVEAADAYQGGLGWAQHLLTDSTNGGTK